MSQTYFRLRNIHSTVRTGANYLKTSDENHGAHRRKFFRHQKKFNKEHRSVERKYEIPEHEFEEKFEVKPPPKENKENITEENQQFKGWFFRDSTDDLEAAESQFYNNTQVIKEIYGLSNNN